MASQAAFQTRARAVDHLGRGQIADCPTAVTELWKNAYDAYAKNVSLHVFEGPPHVAAIFDDGCGMDKSDIDEKWLVIGTESKSGTNEVPVKDRLGLSLRPKLGEKGIGRLSAGFLAPVTLLVSKKADSGFVAVLVDWRFFENPYLLVSDIQVPIEEFDSIDELPKRLERMVANSKRNLTGATAKRKEDTKRIVAAWRAYSADEKKNKVSPNTAARIESLSANKIQIAERLENWSVAAELSDHGTAIILVELSRELAVWVDPKVAVDDIEAVTAKNNLKLTLAGLVDPDDVNMQNFDYYVEVHKKRGRAIEVDSNSRLDSLWLSSLEHYVSGHISSEGLFTGNVVAFGIEQKKTKFKVDIPNLIDKRGKSRIGSFAFEIATIEQTAENSSHDLTNIAIIKQRQDSNGGMMVYRDGVRVLPYGRPDSDFFELEETRGRHAGREFWAHKRVFGRIRLTRDENPNLRDKAGREGLVQNEAKRLLKLVVKSILMKLARKYFGTDSPIRDEELARIQARNERGKEAIASVRKKRRKEFLADLRSNKKVVDRLEPDLEKIAKDYSAATKSKDVKKLTVILNEVESIKEQLESAHVNPLPKGLEVKEEEYRKTRDAIETLHEEIYSIEEKTLSSIQKINKSDPAKLVADYRLKQVKALERQSKAKARELENKSSQLSEFWKNRLVQGLSTFESESQDISDEVADEVAWGIGEIQLLVEQYSSMLIGHAESVQRSMGLLLDGIDIDSALAISDENQMFADEKIQQLNLLAQSGIAVELIGHELEEMAQETESNFERMPGNCKSTAAYKRAFNGFASLVDRFRFLTPFSVASYRSRREITGQEITEFVEEFFERRFENSNVDFKASKAFDAIAFNDVPSRIFPVFINLVNNSLYWLKFSKKKQIRFDIKKGLVLVADTGPGIDRDDVDSLFQIFFTKRPQGRGVGLYLCKTNLAVARHKIRYAEKKDPKILGGANFIIEFRGVANE